MSLLGTGASLFLDDNKQNTHLMYPVNLQRVLSQSPFNREQNLIIKM